MNMRVTLTHCKEFVKHIPSRCESEAVAMFFAKLRRLGRDDTGANTVEYTLVSAIVALGIVASLIALKTNLNAVFGGASLSVKTSTTQSNAANAGYWGSKPLKGPPVTTYNTDLGLKTVTYSYKDGTVVAYTTSTTGIPFEEVAISDPNKLETLTARADPNGNQNFYILNSMDPNMTTILRTQNSLVPDSFRGNPSVPYRMTDRLLDAAGNTVSSTGVINATTDYITRAVDSNEALVYFRDLGRSV